MSSRASLDKFSVYWIVCRISELVGIYLCNVSNISVTLLVNPFHDSGRRSRNSLWTRILVYHQGVCQGDGTCRQGLVLQNIDGRSRVGSTPRGETGSVRTLLSVSCVHTPTFSLSTVWRSMRLSCSHGTLRWRLKSLCQTTRTRMGSLTLSLTPSLNPKMTLTKFLRHVTRRVSVSFFIFIFSFIFIFYLHIFAIFYLQNHCTQIEHVLH